VYSCITDLLNSSDLVGPRMTLNYDAGAKYPATAGGWLLALTIIALF
jgi:hypothetical protein